MHPHGSNYFHFIEKYVIIPQNFKRILMDKENNYTSRFVIKKDKNSSNFVFDLHPMWWSRPYEYMWAAEFADKDDIALDAACGISHPLKFYLAEKCKDVHACDYDKRIINEELLLKEVKDDLGETAMQKVLSDRQLYLGKIKYSMCSIADMPYKNAMFDKIYCISTLEHLLDTKNRNLDLPLRRKIIMKFLGKRDMKKSLLEFKRTLKNDGLIILTFDYPRIDLDYFDDVIKEIGLEYAGPKVDVNESEKLYSERDKLYCYRAVLKKII